MLSRENQEEREMKILSPFAQKARRTLGRKKPEEKCPIRTEFQRDRDRIIHSKAFRRLKYKTQVFISPEGDHYRTRLTHTLEVAQISRTIARALSLNEDLTEAIALGHDLGHTPFGHAGERVLNEIMTGGFKHNEQSIRVVEKIEKKGKGLNLTQEVLEGILNHRSYLKPKTLEGKVVRLSDKIAYINHDIEDALRAGVITAHNLPETCIKTLGKTSSERINHMILDTIKNSDYDNNIAMSEEIYEATMLLRKFMFENVYVSPKKKKEDFKIDTIIKSLFHYYLQNESQLTDEFIFMIQNENESKEKVVCDFIACMTDRFAINTFLKISIPNASWKAPLSTKY